MARRILSLWFPRLAAERVLRRQAGALPAPFAVVADRQGAQVLASLNAEAEAAGLRAGMPLRDATAICAGLVHRAADPLADAHFLTVLRRWAGRFSPWVAEEAPDALVLDLTGCAHLFGGEAALMAEAEADCTRMGLTVRMGLADTRGAAWALARYAGREGAAPDRNGDAIEQEARATRSRAVKRRHWERGGAAPALPSGAVVDGKGVAAPGQTRQALAGLPLTALRLPPEAVEGLSRLGLRRVADIMGLPRAALARRFGVDVLRRLDQALGLEPEPVAPARAPLHFAVRLTLPDPIGLRGDVEAGIDRLLPALCARLKAAARGARMVRLEAFRTDGTVARLEVGLARPADEPDRIRPLLALKLDGLEAGFGIDCLRLEAGLTEPLSPLQHRGGGDGQAVEPGGLDDLLGRLAARLGAEAVTRLHPAESHIPEKSSITLAALWSAPHAGPWPRAATPRPLRIFRPEPVSAEGAGPRPPARFRWRGRNWALAKAEGPERIAPEWWLENPDWRSGPRDYWRVEAEGGARLWLFYAHGGAVSGGWFCQGVMA